MYPPNQDQQHQSYHGAYRTNHQQQRWPDATPNRQDFQGVPPPPQVANLPCARGLAGAPQGMISHERHLSIDIRNQSHNSLHLQPYHRHGQHHHQISGHSTVRNAEIQLVANANHQAQPPPPRSITCSNNDSRTQLPPLRPVAKTVPFPLSSTDQQLPTADPQSLLKKEHIQASVRTQSTDTPTTNHGHQLHSSSSTALQPVDSNCSSTRSQLVLASTTKKSLTPLRKTSELNAGRTKLSVMSPITMCFTQMLGAGKLCYRYFCSNQLTYIILTS